MTKLYTHPKTGVWYVDLRALGLGRCSTGKKDRKEALAVVPGLISGLQSGSYKKNHGGPGTLGNLYNRWLAYQPKNARGRGDKQRALDFVTWAGPKSDIRQITTADVSRWAHALASRHHPATVIRYRVSVSSLFRWALQIGFADTNPVTNAWRPKVPQGKRTPLSVEHIRNTLLSVRGTPLEGAYRLAFFAGLRRSEIARTRWEHIDLERGTLLAPGRKSEGSYATLPIHPELRSWLEAQPDRSGPVVRRQDGLPYHPNSLENLRRDHDPDLPNFHLGRHTLATLLIADGVDIWEVSQLLRHTSVRTTQQFYAWASPSRLGGSLSRLKIN